MTIERVDDKRLIISLSEEDMKIFDITFKKFDWSNDFSKNLINQLLALAKEETGFSTENKKMMIDLLPQNGGCIIFVTTISKVTKEKRKIYKIKKSRGPFIFVFKNIENVINAIDKIRNISIMDFKNKLVEYENCYFLILCPCVCLPTQLKSIFNEYGKLCGEGLIKNSIITEWGNTVIPENAMKVIYQYFCNK